MPRASAFNPRISYADGSPYFKRSSRLLPKAEHLPRGWPAQDCEVPVLTGAAFFVRRSCFDKVGGFDEKIFLYHEDDDLALRLRKACGPLVFAARAHVVHTSGHSSGRSPDVAHFKARHMGCSRIYATRKHNTEGEPRRALAQAIVALLSPENLFSARRRAKNLGFLSGLVQALRIENR